MRPCAATALGPDTGRFFALTRMRTVSPAFTKVSVAVPTVCAETRKRAWVVRTVLYAACCCAVKPVGSTVTVAPEDTEVSMRAVMAEELVFESMTTVPVTVPSAAPLVPRAFRSFESMPVATTVASPASVAEMSSASSALDWLAVSVMSVMSTTLSPSVVTELATELSCASDMPEASITTEVLPMKAEPVKTRLTRFVICVEVSPELIASEPVMPPTGTARILR